MWYAKHAKPAQYEVYITNFAEVIVAPRKSTRNLRYAYIKMFPHWENIEELKKSLRISFPGCSIYSIEKFDWDNTKGISVR